jgi:hypothetical protein
MSRMIVVLLAAGLMPAVCCGAAPAASPVEVHASVDRTAIWVADRVTYTIEIVCARGVDILLDDLARKKLRLNGLEIVSSDARAATDAADRTTHRIRYVLTTYRIDAPSLSIEPLTVRYYARRPGQPALDIAPAGEMPVPGAEIAFRSTLPERQSVYQLRNGRVAAPRSRLLARAQQAGIGLVVIAVVPAAFMFLPVAGRAAKRTPRPSRRQVREDHRMMLDRLRALDVATEGDRRRAYDAISAAVRAHVSAVTRLPAAALTPSELEGALASGGAPLPAESVVPLLASCDAARYGAPLALPSAEACREALTAAEQLLTSR